MKFSKLSLAIVLLSVSALTQAAIPTTAAAAVTGIMADMQSWFDLIFPAIILGVTLTIGPKLLKRLTGKI